MSVRERERETDRWTTADPGSGPFGSLMRVTFLFGAADAQKRCG